MNENECTIEFKCVNNNHKGKILIKEYIEKMRDFNDRNINNDICTIKGHNKNKYECYCLDCNKHLCKECLKSRIHKEHKKINLEEEQPSEEELNIIKKKIEYYDNKMKNIKMN